MTQERLPLKIKKFSQTFTDATNFCLLRHEDDEVWPDIERSFSKMKIVKNYLRSTMKGERLEDLIVLSTEKDLTDTIDLNVILKIWATRKNRKLKIRFKQ
jgi:hypothetical protein